MVVTFAVAGLAVALVAAWLALCRFISPEEQFKLGLKYRDGNQTTQSYTTAAQWFQKAADAGYAPAQFELAALLRLGLGAPQDQDAARRMVEKAAAQGYPPAVTMAGILETSRVGGDAKQGLVWLKAAANFGDPWAQSWLAFIYMDGRLETGDPLKALYWIERAHETDSVNTKDLWRAIWQSIPPSSRIMTQGVVSSQIGHIIQPPPGLDNE
jgi:TPR repeat protein